MKKIMNGRGRPLTEKTKTLLSALPGDVFEISYQADIPRRVCARRGVKIGRIDFKSTNKSYVVVL